MNKEKILVIVAHPGDHVLCAGGTLSQYAKEGSTVKTVVCSYGEKSYPYLSFASVRLYRKKQSAMLDTVLSSKTIQLDMPHAKLWENFKKEKSKQRIAKIIEEEKPSMIFTHAGHDIHPDHRAVSLLVKSFIREKIISCPVYTFTFLGIPFFSPLMPKLISDTTKTHSLKLEAYSKSKKHKSLFFSLFLLAMLARDYFFGFVYGTHTAEVFFRIN